MRKPAKADRPAAPGPAFNPEQLASALATMLTPPQPAPEPEAASEEESDTAVPRLAFTISEFCQAHAISISTYRRLRQAGKGPVEMEIMSEVRISVEAAEAWRRSREPSAPPS